MRRLALVLLLVACGRPTPTLGVIDPRPMTMDFAEAPVVGTKTTEKVDYTLDMNLTVSLGSKSASRHIKGSGTATRHEEVLAVSGDAITKLKVTYENDSGTLTNDDGNPESTKADPRDGKTYIVEGEGAATVTADGGGAVPEAEQKKVSKDYSWLGKPGGAHFTGKQAFTPGQRVGEELYAKVKRDAERSGISVDSAELTYRGAHDSNAAFDIDIKVSKEASFGTVSLSLKGQVGLCPPDGRTCEFAGSGELLIDASEGEASIKGDGIFEGHVKRTLD